MDTASYGMNCQFNHEIPMRDGVILRGNLYTPKGHGPWPVLLLRSVFRKDHLSRAFSQYDPAFFVKHGYAIYMQDVRGLGASDGEFDRFTADGPDGYDTIEYLAAQPWCTGRVGMMGSYYAGYLQMMAAAENPPHLSAIVPMQTSVSINRDCDNRGFMFFSHIGWNMSRLCVAARIPKQNRREFQNTPIYIQYAKNGLRISPPQAIFSCLYVLLTLATSPPPPPAAGPPLVQSPGVPQYPRCRVLPALPPQASSRCPQKDPVCARPERRCRQPPA